MRVPVSTGEEIVPSFPGDVAYGDSVVSCARLSWENDRVEHFFAIERILIAFCWPHEFKEGRKEKGAKKVTFDDTLILYCEQTFLLTSSHTIFLFIWHP
jgi:hypothetical protein